MPVTAAPSVRPKPTPKTPSPSDSISRSRNEAPAPPSARSGMRSSSCRSGTTSQNDNPKASRMASSSAMHSATLPTTETFTAPFW